MSRKRLTLIIIFFVALGLASELFLWRIPKNDIPLAILAPVLSASYFLEKSLPFIKSLSPVQSEFALIVPLVVIYFGLIGIWVGKIWREEGFYKFVTLLCLAGFLVIIHWQAFGYLKSLLSA